MLEGTQENLLNTGNSFLLRAAHCSRLMFGFSGDFSRAKFSGLFVSGTFSMETCPGGVVQLQTGFTWSSCPKYVVRVVCANIEHGSTRTIAIWLNQCPIFTQFSVTCAVWTQKNYPFRCFVQVLLWRNLKLKMLDFPLEKSMSFITKAFQFWHRNCNYIGHWGITAVRRETQVPYFL